MLKRAAEVNAGFCENKLCNFNEMEEISDVVNKKSGYYQLIKFNKEALVDF